MAKVILKSKDASEPKLKNSEFQNKKKRKVGYFIKIAWRIPTRVSLGSMNLKRNKWVRRRFGNIWYIRRKKKENC